MSTAPRILYLAPDYDVPSWGVGLLYHHVRSLVDGGFAAEIVHQRRPFRVRWLDLEVPIRHLDGDPLALEPEDLVVVPEVLARSSLVRQLPCRRLVFVQNGFVIIGDAETAIDYSELGYEGAIVTMPHLARVLETHFGLAPDVVPPFVAPYFFIDEAILAIPRKRRALLFAKPQYGEAGYLDYDIAGKLLRRAFADTDWELVELSGKTHAETAAAMQRASIFVNLNTLEGFNVTVAEAMAAGCVAVCYEAWGGGDYLAAGRNAFVLANNHVYSLVDTVLGLARSWEERSEEIDAIRRAGLATARTYRRTAMDQAILGLFRRLTTSRAETAS